LQGNLNSMSLTFKSRNVALVNDFLSLDQCQQYVQAISVSPAEPAQVVRAGESLLDKTLRHCLDHHLPSPLSKTMETRFTSFFYTHRDELGSDADSLYGPYFMSYGPGNYFRAHRDVDNHKSDPLRLATHRWSLLVYLNGRRPAAELPTFDGGALVLYETDPSLRDRRITIIPEPGLLVLFRSSLMHEVTTVREGVRYAVAGWMSNSKHNPFGVYA
jgi:Rps23 Pro-64 3,4-dihydroxylase Tpa1-like proline 4-hydroxylase